MEIVRDAGLPPRRGELSARRRRGDRPGAGRAIPTSISSPSPARGRSDWRSIEQAAEHQPGQRHVKKVIAEMGGKNAIIVDDDADLDEAVQGVVHSAFGYAGQKCSACSRVIVLQDVYDTFSTG